MTLTRAVLGTLVLTTALTACGGGGEASPSGGKTVTVTVDPTPSNSPSDTSAAPSPSATPFAPNVGATALRLGQTRNGRQVNTTVYEVRQPARAPSYAQPSNPGNEWIAVRAKSCVKSGDPIDVDWIDFQGADRDGGNYEAAGDSWTGWPPTPQYPRATKVGAGRCVGGWMLFDVQKGQRFTSIYLGRAGEDVAAEWKIP